MNDISIMLLLMAYLSNQEETYYLMKNPRNAARLTAAIDEVEKMVAKDNI